MFIYNDCMDFLEKQVVVQVNHLRTCDKTQYFVHASTWCQLPKNELLCMTGCNKLLLKALCLTLCMSGLHLYEGWNESSVFFWLSLQTTTCNHGKSLGKPEGLNAKQIIDGFSHKKLAQSSARSLCLSKIKHASFLLKDVIWKARILMLFQPLKRGAFPTKAGTDEWQSSFSASLLQLLLLAQLTSWRTCWVLQFVGYVMVI